MSRSLHLNTWLIYKDQNRQLLPWEGGKSSCVIFFLEETFPSHLKKKKTSFFRLSHIRYFLSLKRLLSDFYHFHLPVANASILPFYKSAQLQALSDSYRLTIFLFKWLMVNQSQMWRSGRWFGSFVIVDTDRLTWQKKSSPTEWNSHRLSVLQPTFGVIWALRCFFFTYYKQ